MDAAIRAELAGRETPLILAATRRLASVYRQVNSYPHLLDEGISDSPDRIRDGELAQLARPLLEAAYAAKIDRCRALFERRAGEGRAISDVAQAARAATFGAIDMILVNMDSVVPGLVDEETGAVSFAEKDDASAYGVVDEIASRALASGARVW